MGRRLDVLTGAVKGRLRDDTYALRLVEVVIDGPKSWSLAASLDPDIATAYEAAMDRAAGEVIGGWPSTPPPGSGHVADRCRRRSSRPLSCASCKQRLRARVPSAPPVKPQVSMGLVRFLSAAVDFEIVL